MGQNTGLDNEQMAKFSKIKIHTWTPSNIAPKLLPKRNENVVNGLAFRVQSSPTELEYNDHVQKSIWNKAFFFKTLSFSVLFLYKVFTEYVSYENQAIWQ